MAVTLLFRNQKSSISSLELDATLSEQHTAHVTVTMHPVEQGVKITDHKLREPDALVIEGLVTNDPSPALGQASAFDPTRAGTAYQQLLALLDSPDLLAVVTSIRSYSDLVMTDLQVPRDPASGQALRFTATFTQVRIVQNQTVTVQAKTTRATANKDEHKKTTPEAAKSMAKKSILKSATTSQFAQHPVDTITNLFSGSSSSPTGRLGF